MFKTLVGSGLGLLGLVLGLIDWRGFGRPWFGLALLAAAGLGAVMALLFPLILAGVLLVAGAALALSGYAVAGLVWVVAGEIARARKARSS